MTHIALIRRLSAGNRKAKYSSFSPFCNSLNSSPDLKRERDDNYLNNSRNDRLQSFRKFHATPKKEILPLIAIGVGVVGMYSFRALKRMDREWEEYQEELAEYNLEHGVESSGSGSGTGSPSQGNSVEKNLFSGGKMAIDLGTLNIRVAHKSSSSDDEKPSVIVNREGSRATPNHILFDTDGSFVTGTLASGKFYERSNSNTPVVNVGQLARSASTGNDGAVKDLMIEEVLSACAKNALEQAVGETKGSSSGTKSLFSIDSGGMDGYNVQPVFTYTPKVGSHDDYLEEYTNAVKNLSSPSSIALFEPEPLCAVRAAKYNSLLPIGMPGAVLVIDVGASATSMSIVDGEKESIQYHSRLDGFGGETLLETLMDYLSKSFFGCRHTEASDKMAIQRLYDAAQGAIMERQKLGRIQINIPYLSMDEKMQPRHLNEGLSLSVLESAFDDMVKDNIAGRAMEQNVLSQTNQNPSDVSALFSSMIMSVLENSGQNPFSLNSILVVGGGARSPMCQQAIKKAIGALAGEQFVAEKVIIPQDELIEELVVLGATLE